MKRKEIKKIVRTLVDIQLAHDNGMSRLLDIGIEAFGSDVNVDLYSVILDMFCFHLPTIEIAVGRIELAYSVQATAKEITVILMEAIDANGGELC